MRSRGRFCYIAYTTTPTGVRLITAKLLPDIVIFEIAQVSGTNTGEIFCPTLESCRRTTINTFFLSYLQEEAGEFYQLNLTRIDECGSVAQGWNFPGSHIISLSRISFSYPPPTKAFFTVSSTDLFGIPAEESFDAVIFSSEIRSNLYHIKAAGFYDDGSAVGGSGPINIDTRGSELPEFSAIADKIVTSEGKYIGLTACYKTDGSYYARGIVADFEAGIITSRHDPVKLTLRGEQASLPLLNTTFLDNLPGTDPTDATTLFWKAGGNLHEIRFAILSWRGELIKHNILVSNSSVNP